MPITIQLDVRSGAHRCRQVIDQVKLAIATGSLSPCVQMAHQGEKAVVLRFGQFRDLEGSGLFTVFPIIHTFANRVDGTAVACRLGRG